MLHPPQVVAPDGEAGTLLAALHASWSIFGRGSFESLSTEGADVDVAWQSLFLERVGHIGRGETPPGPMAERALGIVREALGTQACGPDTCEAWSDRGRGVVRFALDDGHWAVRALIEDAPASRTSAASTGAGQAREIEASTTEDATAEVLRARVREVKQLLGEAPLTATGGTIGVALTDAAPDAPCIVVREGPSARLFLLDVAAVYPSAGDVTWSVGFADVDGDGRTDVALRMNTTRRPTRSPLSWTQVFLAPAPSMQASSVEQDLASALVAMGAPDAKAAARAAASLPPRGVPHDDACRLLSTASTPTGFRRVASADARLLLFQDPGRPTYRPKVVLREKAATDDVRELGAHCSELSCVARAYCSWSSGTDSEHVWFGWTRGKLELVGAANYDGE